MAVSAADPQHINLQTNLLTDANGSCAVPLLASNLKMLVVGALADGYEERCCAFLRPPDPIPSGYTLKLPRGSWIGGVVKDPSGNPVAGAEIEVQFYGTGDSDAREFQRERPGFPDDSPVVATTDANGRWRFGSAPETNGDFIIGVTHPFYSKTSFHTDVDSLTTTLTDRVKLADLHASTAILVLKSGLAIRGLVTDEARKPLPGAKVRFGEFFGDDNPGATTSSDGAFVVNGVPAGLGHITITAAGFAPERLAVDVATNSEPVVVQIKPGGLLRLRVVDDSGNPQPGVDVRLQAWRGNNTLEWGGITDDQGRIEWSSAPRDEVNIYAGKEGFFNSRNNLFVADGEEHTIALHPQLTVSGFVTDAETRQPIPRFKAIPGSGPYGNWKRLFLANGTNGHYSLTFQEYEPPLQIRFESDGYEPKVSPPFDPRMLTFNYDVELTKQNPDTAIHGVVLLPDGSPTAGVQVALLTTEKGVMLGDARFLNPSASILATTDSSGRFAFSPDSSALEVVAINAQGFGRAAVTVTNRQFVVVQIQPWGRIEGVLKLDRGSVAGRQMTLAFSPFSHEGPPVTLANNSSAETDSQGNFTFGQVPPGDFDLYLNSGIGIPLSHQTRVHVEPGATARVQVGGTGATVTGRFVLPDSDSAVNWPKQMRFATLGTQSSPPPAPAGLNHEEWQQWETAFWRSAEGRARVQAMRSYPLEITADGSFVAEDVPAGTYVLSAQLFDSPFDPRQPGGGHVLGSLRQEVTVPDLSGNSPTQTFDIGTLTIEPASR